jgi:hypothetical protein
MTSGGYSRRDIWAGRLYAVRLAAALLRKRTQRVGWKRRLPVAWRTPFRCH